MDRTNGNGRQTTAGSRSAAATSRPVHVVADDREAGSGVIEALKALDDVEVTVERLTLGDYEVDGRVLFERKTLFDLTISIKDGRLFQQAARLAGAPKHVAVILEGTARDLRDSGMRREAIQGALITLTLIFGIPVLRSMGPEETARLMLYAAKQVRMIVNGALPRKGVRPKGKRKLQLQILQGLPGVGPGRARRLLEAFGSVQAVFQASANDLLEVSGIGANTAKTIRWAVGETRATSKTEG